MAGLWLCDTRIVSVASPPPPPDAFIGCYTPPPKPRFSPVLHRGHPNLGGKCLPFGRPAEINPGRIREWLSFLLKSQMHPGSSSSMMLLVFPLPRKMFEVSWRPALLQSISDKACLGCQGCSVAWPADGILTSLSCVCCLQGSQGQVRASGSSYTSQFLLP